ncbi:MAG: Uma2 family endonuclease [Cyanobacteria bacterium J06621_3]
MVSTLTKPEIPITITDLTWREFKAAEQLIDRPGIRLSFLDGLLEIRRMSGEKHETIKERIGTLLDLYFLQAGIDYTPTGSMTLESEKGLVKRDADKSYKLSSGLAQPNLAIEVVVTSGGIDKLAAYKRLGMPEVWFWENGSLAIHYLRITDESIKYEQLQSSEALPSLDIATLTKCINISNHVEAVEAFQQTINSNG